MSGDAIFDPVTREDPSPAPLVKFLPSYVGSKSHWVQHLDRYKGRHFAELFCGSAVLSANLARTAVLNDLDPYVHKILSEFDKLEVPASFTQEDYMRVRSQPDWWRYIYCLQKMSFSGVFRYSKNGYNVPMKPEVKVVSLQHEYARALRRYRELAPVVLEQDYLDVPVDHLRRRVVVLDPPYEGSKAAYNGKFDYRTYWDFVLAMETIAGAIILFDEIKNMPFEGAKTRSMVVNGKHAKNVEGMLAWDLPEHADGSWDHGWHRGLEVLDPARLRGHRLRGHEKGVVQHDYYDLGRCGELSVYEGFLSLPSDWLFYFFTKDKSLFKFDLRKLRQCGGSSRRVGPITMRRFPKDVLSIATSL